MISAHTHKTAAWQALNLGNLAADKDNDNDNCCCWWKTNFKLY